MPADKKRYRGTDSYVSKDPIKRQRQLENLTMGRKRQPKPIASSGGETKGVDGFADDIIGFAENHFYIIETRKPIKLLDWQKEILREIFHSDKTYSLALLGMCKKSGKSTLAALIALWFLISKPFAEVYILGPDWQQGMLVVFDKIVKAIRMHKMLSKVCKIGRDFIQFGDSKIIVLGCSTTNAGLNPDLVIIDEAWQFDSVEAKRTLDELTTTPTKDMLTLVTTYAGYEDSTDLHLWQWYRAGLEGTDPAMFFLWRTDYADIPWVDEKYLETQKKRLRENTYLRLHCNQWVSNEQAFISAAVVDACTNAIHKRGQPVEGRVTVGVDIGLKHDCSAVVVVGKVPGDNNTLAVIDHAVFVPASGLTLDLEKTVESILLIYNQTYDIAACFYDPFQFARSAKTLQTAGLPMREYPQTVGNTVLMSETLSGLLNNQELMLYNSAELREHLLNAQAKETQRGWRIVKRRESQKIDLAVALGMACQSAQENFLLSTKVTLDFIAFEDEDSDPEDRFFTDMNFDLGFLPTQQADLY